MPTTRDIFTGFSAALTSSIQVAEIKKKIVKARGVLGDDVLEWLDAKFTKHNMGM